MIRKELNLNVVIPSWLDEIELKPIEVVQPVQVISVVKEIQPEIVNKALAAEEMYLRIRSKLNELYQESYTSSQYDELIEKLKKLEIEL